MVSGFPPVVNAIMEEARQGTLSRQAAFQHVLTYAFGTREDLDRLAVQFPAAESGSSGISGSETNDISEDGRFQVGHTTSGSQSGNNGTSAAIQTGDFVRSHPPIKCLTSVLIAFRDEFEIELHLNQNGFSGPSEAGNRRSSDAENAGAGSTTNAGRNAATADSNRVISEVESLLQKAFQGISITSDSVYEYMSQSGRFRFEYTLTGDHAVPLDDTTESGVPDYVEMAAIYADSSWNYLVGTLGFPDPVRPSSPYLIRFVDFNFYGRTNSTGNTTFIEVHSNFNGFPPNLDPDGHQLGALKATIAHELKHAIQYVTNRWLGDAGTRNWLELDATMTEDVVFSTVKDYLNYLPSSASVFRGAHNGIPGSYWQATFGLYYHQRFGPEFWVRTWDEIRRNNNLQMFNAMRNALEFYDADFATEFFMNMAWHMAAGSRSRPDFGFTSRELYPDVNLSSGSGPLPAFGSTTNFNKYSARFYEITPQSSLTGNPVAGLLRAYPSQSIGSVAFLHDGSVRTTFAGHISAVQDFTGFVQETDWSEIERFGLVVVNTGERSSLAQFIVGTDAAGGLFQYGDVNLDGALNSADAENLLMSVVGSQGPRATAASLLQHSLADVSDDGTLSVFDAALIFQKVADPLNTEAFPADPDGRGSFPAVSRVFRPEVGNPPLSSIALLAKTSDEVTEGSAFEMRFEQSSQPDDDTLRVYVQTLMDGLWSSVFAEVSFDSNLVALQRVYMPGVDSRRYIQRFQFSNTGARIGAIGRNGDVSGDILALYFVPLADTMVTIGLPYIELDEADGSITTRGITASVRPAAGVGIEQPSDLPVAARLLPNYPNPFNSTTTITFELGLANRVQLDVFDASGRHIAGIFDGIVAPGRHNARFDASGLATGLYFVRMMVFDTTSGSRSHSQTQKILYIR
jgi:hypothetical protein